MSTATLNFAENSIARRSRQIRREWTAGEHCLRMLDAHRKLRELAGVILSAAPGGSSEEAGSQRAAV